MMFLNPNSLLLLLLLPLLIVFLIWRNRQRELTLERLGNIKLFLSSVSKSGHMGWWVRTAIWGTTMVLSIIALARPVWGEEVRVIQVEGVSVFIVLDVSRSMNAQDMLPSRLERAKLATQDLFASLTGNEFGLILFAGSAFVRFPLTVDHLSAQTFLQNVESDAISIQGTNIQSALQLAIDHFSDTRSSRRYIILMTDGEAHIGDISDVVAEASQLRITIFTLGYGTVEGSPVPIYDSGSNVIGFESDASGNPVISLLNETLLQTISDQTGGIYQRATASGDEVEALVRVIESSPTTSLSEYREIQGVERFQIFVWLAFLCLSFEIIIAGVRPKLQ